jgi:hypothetical protein
MGDLKTRVWVKDPNKGGQDVPLDPGDEIPDWAHDQLGDHVFVDDERPEKTGNNEASSGGAYIQEQTGEQPAPPIAPTHLDQARAAGQAMDVEEEDDDDAGSADKKPAGNATTEEWQDYARSQGASDEDLEGQSRDDLRKQYG